MHGFIPAFCWSLRTMEPGFVSGPQEPLQHPVGHPRDATEGLVGTLARWGFTLGCQDFFGEWDC